MDYSYIDENLREVRERIEAACSTSEYGKKVTMVAAVKYADIGEIYYL